MAEQEQIRKSPAREATTTDVEAEVETPATSERGEKIKAELDDLLVGQEFLQVR